MSSGNGPGSFESSLENLSKLSNKPGVKSTLILSRLDGSIIRSTGLPEEPTTPVQGNASFVNTILNGDGNHQQSLLNYGGSGNSESHETTVKGAESVARMVFSFVIGAKNFIESMDSTDDMRLLRLRTRKNEIMIVPDPKFILVVMHDAP